MIAIRVRLRTDRLAAKIDAAKEALPAAAEAQLVALAEDAVRLVQNAPEDERRGLIARALSRQFRSVFVPVMLKHKRPETWPNLRPIYDARIVRGQKTLDGRRLFYVDEHKENALFDELLARALAAKSDDVYEVRFMTTYDRRFRVEIVRRGGGPVPAVVVAYARQRMKVVAVDTMTAALSKAGLR